VHLDDGTHVDTAAVLLATPPRAIAWLVREIDPELSSLLSGVRDVLLITVALAYRRVAVRHPLAGSGFVVPSSERASVNAVTWMSSKSLQGETVCECCWRLTGRPVRMRPFGLSWIGFVPTRPK
jgi:oxygen-dependent protoporphyrinogen oxidase